MLQDNNRPGAKSQPFTKGPLRLRPLMECIVRGSKTTHRMAVPTERQVQGTKEQLLASALAPPNDEGLDPGNLLGG